MLLFPFNSKGMNAVTVITHARGAELFLYWFRCKWVFYVIYATELAGVE